MTPIQQKIFANAMAVENQKIANNPYSANLFNEKKQINNNPPPRFNTRPMKMPMPINNNPPPRFFPRPMFAPNEPLVPPKEENLVQKYKTPIVIGIGLMAFYFITRK